MKSLLIAVFLSLFLFSCSEGDKNDELMAEYEVVEANQQKNNPIVEAPQLPQGPKYKLGVEYEKLDVPYDTENTEQVVVYEFFGYTCPHCFYFEPFIEKWLKTKRVYINFTRVPLNFQPGWGSYQQAYLTAELMGFAQEGHAKLFKAIHNDHKHFDSIDELADWYASETGVKKKAFLSTADSFVLDSKQRKADKMGFLMKVKGTPTVVVNGKYKISTKIRNRDEIISVMDFLIEKEAKEMGLVVE
jgi:thiol:disulfide interchange protein DsbA